MNNKAPKPYPTFPLFAHAKGHWCKKIEQRQVSFGKWAWPDPDAYERSWKEALERYNKHLEDVAHGRAIVPGSPKLTISDVVNAFLAHQHRRTLGRVPEIGATYFSELRRVTTQFREFVGRSTTIAELEKLNPARQQDSKVVAWLEAQKKRYGWHAYNGNVGVIASLFNWAEHPVTGILQRPFRLKALFVKRAEVHRRREKREREAVRGKQRWTASELQGFFQHAANPLRAMFGLMYFAGYGQGDCASLPKTAIDWTPDAALGLPAGWGVVTFPRPKTEVDRAAVLPRFVMEDLRASIDARPAPADPVHRRLVFMTPMGNPWVRDIIHEDPKLPGVIKKAVRVDSIGQEFRRLRDQLAFCREHGWHCPPGRGAGFRSDRRGLQLAAKRPRPPRSCPVCGGPVQPMRPLPSYTFRHTAVTYASGVTDEDARALLEGHVIAGVRRHYVEEIDTAKLLLIAQRLLQRAGLGDDGKPFNHRLP